MSVHMCNLKKLLISQVLLIIIFLGTALVVTILQAICFTTVRPFSLYTYRCIDFYINKTLHIHFVFLLQWWASSDLEIYSEANTDPRVPKSENSIIIGNHSTEIDLQIHCTTSYTMGFLGVEKFLMKRELSKLPVLGWYWRLHENIFLDRNWQKDETNLGKQLKHVFTENPYPVCIPVMPEGTRYTAKKHKQSLKIAREKGLPEYKNVLLPRTKGFSVLNQHRDKNAGFTTILDITICCDPNSAEPTFRNLMSGSSSKIKVFVKQWSMDEVPLDEEESAKWLYSLFEEKDRYISKYLETAKIPDNFTKYVKARRTWATLLNFIFWAVVVLGPLAYLILKSLFSGSYASVNVLIIVVTLATYGLNSIMGAASVKKI